MLFRFSLYGFLKNQRYFEPFLLLFLLDKGLNYFWIGLLIGFGQVCVNVMEVPTGAIADLYGRRRCMVLSMASYILSFLIFAYSREVWQLFAAMLLFGIGDAFRTGTHKAIILDWLRSQGRQDEKTRTYGYTRSWSKIGSALSAVIGAGVVLYTVAVLGQNRITEWLFLLAVVPYVVNVVNLWSYPRYLDGDRRASVALGPVFRHLKAAARQVIRRADMRRLLAESMAYEGIYAAVKDYLQPVLKALAVVGLAAGLLRPLAAKLADAGLHVGADGGSGRAAIVLAAVMIAPVYFALEIVSSVASRLSHRFAARFGGEEGAARRLWRVWVIIFALMTPLLYMKAYVAIALGFVALAAVQNLWRPVQVSRYDSHSHADFGATILSVDSQAKALTTAIVAPLLGLCIDLASPGVAAAKVAEKNFWPIGVVGLAVGVVMVFVCRRDLAPPEVLDGAPG